MSQGHCWNHAEYKGGCADCYRADIAATRNNAIAKWGKPHAPKPAPEKPQRRSDALPIKMTWDEPQARKTDPGTAHEGVKRIRESSSKNRLKILALDFGEGLNYREIGEQADIYPTTVSRLITTMVRENDLQIVGERDGCQLYIRTASSSAMGE